eukprot:2305029-Rhodomonas_salina.1
MPVAVGGKELTSGHCSHIPLPETLLKAPAGHGMQTAEPGRGAYDPTLHCQHSVPSMRDCRLSLLKPSPSRQGTLPAGHKSHRAPPLNGADQAPGGQG